MPTKKEKEQIACADAEELVNEVVVEKKFLLVNLLDKAEALGYSKFIACGAFYNVSLDTEMTKAKFIETIEDYRKRKVV